MTDFEARRLRIVAVSADDAAAAKKLKADQKLAFAVVSDPERKVTMQFGVASPRAPIPWASVFLVSRQGEVLWRAIETVRKRVRPQQILDAADKHQRKKDSK